MRSLYGRTLRRLQKDAVQLMRDTCVVSRIDGWTEDADGVQVPREVPVYEGVCKVQSWNPESRDAVSVGTPKAVQRYIVHFPAGTEVEDGDIVRVVDRSRPLFLRGSHDLTIQTAVRMQADEEANADG